MPINQSIKIGLLKKNEVEEADQIVRLAFGTFLGLPNPLDFMGDRNVVVPRFRSRHITVLAARESGRLIGLNVATRWGSFAFFGPLVVLPEYWDKGVAQRLMASTIDLFDKWGVRHSGLFTFAQSARHIGLYQKFGYWPRFLTATMTRKPVPANPGAEPVTLSRMTKPDRKAAIEACAKLTDKIDKGLDLTGEIESTLDQHTGDVVLTYTGRALDGFAVCMHGAGSEGGSDTCYIKFGAARSGKGAGERFDALLRACEAYAAARCLIVEAGMNLAQQDACGRMIARGYRTSMLGVAMNRPNDAAFYQPDNYIVSDLR